MFLSDKSDWYHKWTIHHFNNLNHIVWQREFFFQKTEKWLKVQAREIFQLKWAISVSSIQNFPAFVNVSTTKCVKWRMKWPNSVQTSWTENQTTSNRPQGKSNQHKINVNYCVAVFSKEKCKIQTLSLNFDSIWKENIWRIWINQTEKIELSGMSKSGKFFSFTHSNSNR